MQDHESQVWYAEMQGDISVENDRFSLRINRRLQFRSSGYFKLLVLLKRASDKDGESQRRRNTVMTDDGDITRCFFPIDALGSPFYI